MNSITLKQLKYFDALARHGHFGRAAEASAITQPALSVQIKELEENLGIQLFERGARNIRLTAFGAEALGRVRGILRAVDELSELARSATDGFAGKLRLGVIPTVAPYLLPQLVTLLTKRHERLDIQVRETVTPNLVEELSDGRLDAAIVALPVGENGLTEVALFDEPILLVRPASAADQPLPTSDSLLKERLLLLEEGHCFRDHALNFCNLENGQRPSGLDGSSLATLVQMVGAGIGLTLVPEMAIDVETRTANVQVARLPDPQPERTIGMIWRKTSPLSEPLSELAEVVRQASFVSRPRPADASHRAPM